MTIFTRKILYPVLAKHAAGVLRKNRPFVIGVSGGQIKRTAPVRSIYNLLHDSFGEVVRKNNNLTDDKISVLLTILGYKKAPNVFALPVLLFNAIFCVCEPDYPKYLVLGLSSKNLMDSDYLSKFLRLDLGIITENGKSSIIPIVKDGSKVIINKDEDITLESTDDNLVGISIKDKSAHYCGVVTDSERGGNVYRIVTRGQNISIKSNLSGENFIYGDLFAFAVGQSLGIQSLQIKKSLENLDKS